MKRFKKFLEDNNIPYEEQMRGSSGYYDAELNYHEGFYVPCVRVEKLPVIDDYLARNRRLTSIRFPFTMAVMTVKDKDALDHFDHERDKAVNAET